MRLDSPSNKSQLFTWWLAGRRYGRGNTCSENYVPFGNVPCGYHLNVTILAYAVLSNYFSFYYCLVLVFCKHQRKFGKSLSEIEIYIENIFF